MLRSHQKIIQRNVFSNKCKLLCSNKHSSSMKMFMVKTGAIIVVASSLIISYFLYWHNINGGSGFIINFSNNACSEFYYYPIWFISKNCYVNLNVMSDTPTMILRNGFHSESYSITTPDGYILTLFRIKLQENEDSTNKQPVFIQHGLLVDSDSWVGLGNRSLAFILALQGYDVWLGNMRGTKYSRLHRVLKDSDFEYWDFKLNCPNISLQILDIIAANDIKTSLETVASVTNKNRSIIYIGHSLGTSVICMLAAEFPTETEHLLRGMILLSPTAFMDIKPHHLPLFLGSEPIGKTLKNFNILYFFYDTRIIHNFSQYLCTFLPYVCKGILEFLSGESELFKPDDLLLGVSMTPATMSLPLFRQFSQQYMSKKFQKFDYGKEGNLEKYGQKTPPIYNLSKINKLPVFMFYGQRDVYISEKSVRKIYDRLGTTKKEYVSVLTGIKDEKYHFGHIDFMYSNHLKTFFSDNLQKIMENELQQMEQY